MHRRAPACWPVEASLRQAEQRQVPVAALLEVEVPAAAEQGWRVRAEDYHQPEALQRPLFHQKRAVATWFADSGPLVDSRCF